MKKMKFPVITGITRVPPVPTPSGTYSGGQNDGNAVFGWWTPVLANRKFEGRECEVKQSVGEKLRMNVIHRMALRPYGLLLFVPFLSLRDYNRNDGYRRLELRSTSKNRNEENRFLTRFLLIPSTRDCYLLIIVNELRVSI